MGERSNIHLDDLRGRDQVASKLMNVTIPNDAVKGIDRVVAETGCTKTDVVIALFNEGVDVWAELSRSWTAPPRPQRKRRATPPRAGA